MTADTYAADRSALGNGVALRAIVLLCAILQIAIPALPSLGIGEPIGDRSDGVRTLITPAGFAFSIWGVLYFGSTVYAIWQLLPAQRDNALTARLALPAAGAFLGNALWAGYTQSAGLSIISALIIVFTLVNLLAMLRIFAAQREFTRAERVCAVLPLSLLAGWLTAATIVNIAAALNYHEVTLPFAAPAVAAVILLVGGGIVAAALVGTRGNLWYPLPFLWALWGIIQQGGQRYDAVLYSALASGAIVLVTLLILLAAPDRRRYLG
ncbi:hypothetical protein [Sphingomonas turrisvirgatae]|uniref:Tryptophan-rich sensory protein n=1 Tax=Sphingomonas turrisvirgatae TaxID=1888892 RepID=A0A1E3LT37_9SPHN|nr:hypothetical protein [Sphingomonas turrisvirgatae]ODP36889.1 hypothetical protein BFL28_04050 [Sphingomonas turrisvirgatae]